VYLSVANRRYNNWVLLNGSVTNGGGWTALDKFTGGILWTTSNPAGYDPTGDPFNGRSNGRASTSMANGAPVAVGDIVLVTSYDAILRPKQGTGKPTYGSGGYVFSLSKSTDRILSSFETKASAFGGFSADSHCAFVGYGKNRYPYSSGRGVYGWCIV
jgi:hypothetical protein